MFQWNNHISIIYPNTSYRIYSVIIYDAQDIFFGVQIYILYRYYTVQQLVLKTGCTAVVCIYSGKPILSLIYLCNCHIIHNLLQIV